MITRTGIRGLCNSVTYTRGLDIYRSADKIKEFQIEEKDKEDEVDAVVKGSGKRIYHTGLKYDKDRDCLDSVYCECPAFYSYRGICKHCAAVLLEYVDYKSRQKTIREYMEKQEQAAAEKKKDGPGDSASEIVRLGSPSAFSGQTTAVMRQLLGRQYLRRTAPLVAQEDFGKVELEVFLVCSGRDMKAEFRIGTERKYVLKDIFEFARNMREHSHFAYGKKLGFVHVPEAFSPDSRRIVQFILDWEQRNSSRYIQTSYTGAGYPGAMPKLRTLQLTANDLETLLAAVGDQEFTARIGNGAERGWRLAEGVPQRSLTLKGDVDGLEVKLAPIYSVRGRDKRIYFQNGEVYYAPFLEPAVEDFIDCMDALPGGWAFIYRSDVPVFVRELLPKLEKYFSCTRENFDESKLGLFPVSYEIYLDAPQKDWITCRMLAVYGEERFSVFDQKEKKALRDLPGEMAASAFVSGYFNAYDEETKELALSGDEEKLYTLLTQGITGMQELGEVFVSDALKRMRVTEPPKVKMGVSLSSGLLELDISVENMSLEELMEILSHYDRRKKYYRLKNGSFLNMDDEQLESLLELKQGLRLTPGQLRRGKVRLPAYRALYLDGQLKESSGVEAVKDRGFRALVRNMKTIEDNDFEIPAELESILRGYQKQGFLWMKTLKQNGFGGILADDMGLGKTLQVITFLWSEFLESGEEENRRSLIVTPASLVFNWASEMEQFAPGLPVKMIIGTAAERRRLLEQAGSREVLVTSYELLKRDIDCYEGMEFFCQVIDEAQYIKNHGTQAAKTVKSIQAGFKMALTGTPVENRLSELWSVFDYLMPGFLYSYEQFRKELETPIVQNGDEKATKRLQKMIRPFVLRRLKKDVLKDLPDKIEKNMLARMEDEQKKLYDAHVERLRLMLGRQSDKEFRMSKIQVLAEITKLRQICCHPGLLYENYKGESAKLEMCMELIQNAVNGGHKLLLFSQFTSMLEILTERLTEAGISYYTLTGATSKEKRSELVRAFNQDQTSVFCISLKAGGTGLNLTAADIVIHYDPWWNVAVQNQATDRAHRIGQRNVVSVYKLFVKGSIEEKIRKLQDKKQELAEEILAGEGIDSGSFSREELLELL